ncbi:Rieske 2Fe-2S domain-containing protein [Methylocaldum szegediense]|uniref:4beta-methylsterol monooxygenase n=1 Tax=Methylocaldum szegediense TaxID=73780 RepID=A0ABN8X7U9_9GAMM|nr:Rieske 2Fe-2S domain-containing protein [Methylocaldum szegediense]CAI8930811.1 4beta-methylsterol monooxygenase [Methylocaldum szegediense]
MRNAQDLSRRSPPDFFEAENSRQKARAAGLDPDRWYAVEYERAVKKRQVKEIVFWKTSIALFRGDDGRLAAVQNRCPHRQLKLTHGVVDRCRLRCAYHGWAFDRDGRLVDYSHDSFGKSLIKHQLRTYPVQARYGLIWLFPGNPALAEERKVPEIPELGRDRPWPNFTMDFTWRAHHSMVIDNICDFSHAFLHRKYRPFVDARLTRHEASEDRVYLTYDADMAAGPISRVFVDRARVNTRSIELCYEYPYQWTNTGDSIKNWSFLLPIDEQTTRVFFLFYFDSLKIPLLSRKTPRWLTQLVLNIAKHLVFKPILSEDGFALEAEQQAYERHWDAPPIELNPVVPLFQRLTARKWENYLAQAGAASASEAGPR